MKKQNKIKMYLVILVIVLTLSSILIVANGVNVIDTKLELNKVYYDKLVEHNVPLEPNATTDKITKNDETKYRRCFDEKVKGIQNCYWVSDAKDDSDADLKLRVKEKDMFINLAKKYIKEDAEETVTTIQKNKITIKEKK